MNKRYFITLIVIVMLLCIGVGYAYLETDLKVGAMVHLKKKEYPLLSNYIKDLAKSDTTNLVLDDETDDHNTRYIGSGPNNYVKFNNELWRIIGVFNNIDDGNGNKESRVKLIKNDLVGDYTWDTSSSDVNSGSGVNEWSQADLMKLLNPGYESEKVGGSLYWNRKSGTCYNRYGNGTVSCDFSSNGLSDDAKKFIEDATWYTAVGATDSNKQGDANHFYTSERGTVTGKVCTSDSSCNDGVNRQTKWVGKVGLIYPSDYGYATGDSKDYKRNEILNKNLTYSYYSENNWLYFNKEKAPNYYWTISPSTGYGYYAYYVYYITNSSSSGYLSDSNGATQTYGVFPSVYLKSNTLVTGGNGSGSSPYIIDIK